jgi:hypothetical protein
MLRQISNFYITVPQKEKHFFNSRERGRIVILYMIEHKIY